MPSGRAPLISPIVPGLHREVREERRLLDVGARAVPLVDVAGGGGDFVPLRILRGEVGVELAEDLGLERGSHGVADFLQRRPDVLQIDVLAVLVLAERLGAEVDVHAARRARKRRRAAAT